MLSDSDADGVAPSSDCANVIGAKQSKPAPAIAIRVDANLVIFAAFMFQANPVLSLFPEACLSSAKLSPAVYHAKQ
jgi:hypothetical protein